jgi:hypothetical protein
LKRTTRRTEVREAEKELDKFLEPIKKDIKELTSDKNPYLKKDEKERVRLEVGSVVSKVEIQHWQNVEKDLGRHRLDFLRMDRGLRHKGITIGEITDKMKELGDDAVTMLDNYKSLVETRKFLVEEKGLQLQVTSVGGNMIGGALHSVFNKLTPEIINRIESGWKNGEAPSETAKKLHKELGVFMEEKNVIAIVRGLVISGIPQEKTEAVNAVVNSLVTGAKPSQSELESYGLKESEYKGISTSFGLMKIRNTLAESLDFLKREYPGLYLGEKKKDVTIRLIKIGPKDIANQLADAGKSAEAYALVGGANAIKRFNVAEGGGINWDADGKKPEVTTSGRLAAFVFAQPKELPLRMLAGEQMVPCREDVVINGMKSSDAKKLWDELKSELSLGERDSFVIFITDRELMGIVSRRFGERLDAIQEKGEEMIRNYAHEKIASETPIREVGNDVHPFIRSEIQLSVMLERALAKERVQSES